MNRWRYIALGLAVVFAVELYYGNDMLRLLQNDTQSISHGTTGNGSLEHGKRLLTRGPNFTPYAQLGALLGRTAVHPQVRDVMLDVFDLWLIKRKKNG